MLIAISGAATKQRGKQFEDFLLKHNLSVLNDGSPTYLHPATGYLSARDLSTVLQTHLYSCLFLER